MPEADTGGFTRYKMNKVEFHEFVIVIEDVWKVNNFINCNQQLDEDARGMNHELIIAIEKTVKKR